jgi:DNA-binding protein H-NS
MMARTLVQIKKQIASLEKEAESVRDKEVAGVIARMKSAIAFYGLTQQDLFEAKAKKMGRPKEVLSVAVKKTAKKKAAAKFKDPSSAKTWTGHGKRPGWFVQAIEGGKKPEDLAA